MIIKSLADLQVYQRAHAAADAIYAMLERPVWRREGELRKQMSECSDKIPSNIGEGFGQGTDAHCAHYQRIARGSANEMCAHLRRARRKKLVGDEECARWSQEYESIGKMLTQWIKPPREGESPTPGLIRDQRLGLTTLTIDERLRRMTNNERPTTDDQRPTTND